jgi:hypothetical protein
MRKRPFVQIRADSWDDARGASSCPVTSANPCMENLAYCLEVDVTALAAKRARSMWPGDSDRLFDTPAVTIVLPQEIHNQTVWDRDQMNVNATSLFLGLDGCARCLHTWFRDVI